MFMALRQPPAPHPQKIFAWNNLPASYGIKSKKTFLIRETSLDSDSAPTAAEFNLF
jgi:hypothetical protein